MTSLLVNELYKWNLTQFELRLLSETSLNESVGEKHSEHAVR
jgi:hypothetical protein